MMSCPFLCMINNKVPQDSIGTLRDLVLIFPLMGNVVGYSSSVNGTAM